MAQETTRAYLRLTVLWMIAGCGLGVVCAFALFSPDLVAAHPALNFGRMVGAHRTAMVHGFFFSAVFASSYALLPGLGQVRAIDRPFSRVLAWSGALIVVIGVLAILAGRGSGQEYSDFPPIISILFWLYLVAVALDLGSIAAGSRVLVDHPSLALLLPATLLPAIIYPFILPDWWGNGLFAALRTWISLQSLFILSFTLTAISVAMVLSGSKESRLVVPRGAYFAAIALIVGLGPFLGITNLLNAPIAHGLKAWGAFAGIGVATGLLVIVWLLSPRKSGDSARCMLGAGLAGLGATAIQGIFMVIPPIYAAFHYTSNTEAHVHLALGSLALILLAGALVSIRNLSHKEILNGTKINWGAGMTIGGLAGIVLFQEAAGVVQATAYSRMLGYPDWSGAFRWLELGVVGSGIVALAGMILLGTVALTSLTRYPVVSVVQEIQPEAVIVEPEEIPADGGEE